ncbi:hypothetical protein BH10BAC3_BH10BAC3_28520 [soil metagenome]
MKSLLLLIIPILICNSIFAQNVGIGTNTPQARLHIQGNADTSQLVIDAHSTQGNIRPLIRLRKSDGSDLLWIHSDDSSNIFIGKNAGRTNLTLLNAKGNTFIGSGAGNKNFTGGNNTAYGMNSLYTNVGGREATAIGYNAMQYAFNSGISLSNYNVAVGYEALRGSTDPSANSGTSNTAIGHQAMLNNTSGQSNTALGTQALIINTTGSYNTANGVNSLSSNDEGSYNTANGASALHSNTSGNYNTAIGFQALNINSTGFSNTALGYKALNNSTIPSYNTAIGESALYNSAGDDNTAIGRFAGYGAAGVTFTQCTFLGNQSSISVTRRNVTMVGAFINSAQCTGNNQVLLGNTAIGQIRAQVTGITSYSDARFKYNINDNVKGLEFIRRLKPVTYNENPEMLHNIWGTPDSLLKKIDHSQIKNQHFIGFLAQDVEKAAIESGFDFPGIDVPKNDKEVYSLRYVDFIMPMVKAIQEQQVLLETLQKQVEAGKAITLQIGQQQKIIELTEELRSEKNKISDLIKRIEALEK